MALPHGLKKRLYGYGAILLIVMAAGGWARFIEPEWLVVRELKLSDTPVCRFAFITDLHHKGDTAWLRKVVDRVNGLSPDFVCFTGDIAEKREFQAEALEIISGVKAPLYGVPGNHDRLLNPASVEVRQAFQKTGGKWLRGQPDTAIWKERVAVHGGFASEARPGMKNIVLTHYPEDASEAEEQRDLVLAGHSHGGQVRLPFIGALILPSGTGDYDRGLFETPAGPLYVNPGIGTWKYKLRLLCRPEITVIEL